MQRLQILAPLLVVAGLVSPPAWAMGFGRPTGVTALGQPLNFSIGLRLDEDESVDPACVNAVVTSGDHVLPAHEVRARLEPVATGGFRIRVVTGMVVDEPVVQVNLRVGCPPRLARAFTVLADPPSALARGGEGESLPEAADLSPPPVNPFLAAAGPGNRSGESAAPVVKRPSTARAVVAAAPDPAAASSASARTRQRTSPGRGGARPVLQLDPVEADAMVDPPLRMATRLSAPRPAGAASSTPGAEGPLPTVPATLPEPDRLRALELALAQLRDESARKDRSLADLQSRLRATAVSRPDASVVYALLGLCGLLSAAVVWMLWSRRLERGRAGWWAAAAAEVAEQLAPPPNTAAAFGPAMDRHAAGSSPRSVPGTLQASGPDAAFAPLTQQPMAVPPAPVPASAMAQPGIPEPLPGQAPAEPRRPMTAEELIDLEQQVEFFVVLGQDDAAIDLLMGHVRSTGGVSPLPYLKLLEIYRRRNEQEPYERLRDRFNRRFNGHIPAWDADWESGETLEGHPEALASLQAHWGTPSKLMDLLDEMLFHRDGGRPFAVPAYRELLFLYGIARDLCERESPNGGVDLLLPLGDDDFVARFRAAAAATGMPLVEAPLSLDLDISTGHPDLGGEFRPHSGVDFVVDEDASSKPH